MTKELACYSVFSNCVAAYPKGKIGEIKSMINDSDFVEVYSGILPDQFCDELIKVFDNHKGVYQGRTGGGVDTVKKNSRDLMLDSHADLSEIKTKLVNYSFEGIQRYFDKYSLAMLGAVSVGVQDQNGQRITLNPDNYAVLGKPKLADIVAYLFRSGTINLQRYEKAEGGYPHWHSEQFPQVQSVDALHRVALYMFYLNDVDEGGETEFFYQGRSIRPTKGTMVIAPAGFTHSHRGKVPISHHKYIATSWVMFNQAEQLYGKPPA